jgi:hypothetical protein
MYAWLDRTEHFVDKSIPYLIVVLFGIITIDVFFRTVAEHYHLTILLTDGIILAFFVVDLVFKFNRVRNVPRFVRLYWLDILAVFPFFLMLRLFEEVLLLSERSIFTLRDLFHAGVILEEETVAVRAGEEAAKVARTSEVLAKEGRVALISRWIRPLRRLPRLLKAISFYEHPKHKKTLYHKR